MKEDRICVEKSFTCSEVGSVVIQRSSSESHQSSVCRLVVLGSWRIVCCGLSFQGATKDGLQITSECTGLIMYGRLDYKEKGGDH